ncbi:UbiA-like protein EboC [Albibacterium indicum]|uniref:UbiA-like protein EboC n=1 Tax=Albibacterium indicum TaxID=2292082 RepID=UPI001FE6EA82|nr:UbiA-like protein EboC [Pedobacter indicus]
MKRIHAYLLLMRPANIVTAIADVLAGIAISGILSMMTTTSAPMEILLLCISTIGLYGGGIVFNDVFDYKIDMVERPERVIPSGKISIGEATGLGIVLLLIGIIAALLVNTTAFVLAILTSIAALTYNRWGKHHSLLGPPNMGLCRGLNLLLGVSILPAMVFDLWYIAIVPIIYISAITMISRGEVHGSSRKPLYSAALLYGLVILMILWFAWNQQKQLVAIPFLLGFAFMIYRPLLKAIQLPTGPAIGKSVKAGVIALILMNGAWAAAGGQWLLALVIVALLPFSLWLSKIFAVT